MKYDDLTYDWLDFLAEQKPAKKILSKKILKENVEIISVPNNLNRKPRNTKVEGIVIHHTVTNSAQSTLRVLEKRGYSTNFEVDQSGKIYQYIDPTSEYAIATGGGANKHTVAIDITTGDSSWPAAQIESAKALIYSLAQKFGFEVVPAPDKGPYSWDSWKNKGFTLFRHRNFAATACPTNFPIDQIAGPASFSVDLSNMQQMNYSDSEEREHESDTSGNTSSAGTTGTGITPALINAVKTIAGAGSLEESRKNKLFSINDKTKEKIYSKNKKYFDSLLNYLKKELEITKPVKIILEEDEENSKKVLGGTGGYINEESKIHIFTTGRHIKDIMRSLAHEMVHHRQNIRGEFKKAEPTENGYAQKNPHLRKMEKEAFLKGNMLFRDWEDNYKYRGKSDEQ